MVEKRGLPKDITMLMRQLVMNGHIRMAGTVLYTYFIRCWKLDDEHACCLLHAALGCLASLQLHRQRRTWRPQYFFGDSGENNSSLPSSRYRNFPFSG